MFWVMRARSLPARSRSNEGAVTGPYDVVARVEAASIDALGRLVVSKIQTVEGIARTLTCPVVRL
jgi:DNA-binding Lrp family transcriptional regulator